METIKRTAVKKTPVLRKAIKKTAIKRNKRTPVVYEVHGGFRPNPPDTCTERRMKGQNGILWIDNCICLKCKEVCSFRK